MGLDVRFSIYFHGPCVFPHIKTVYVRPCHCVMDCIVLFSQEEKGGMVERRRERTEWEREEAEWCGAVQQWRTWQLSAGQKDCAEHLLLSPTPLQPPHYLSIYHKAARSNVCSSQDSHREGGWREGGSGSKERKKGKRGTDCMSRRAENEGEVNGAAACAYRESVDDLE